MILHAVTVLPNRAVAETNHALGGYRVRQASKVVGRLQIQHQREGIGARLAHQLPLGRAQRDRQLAVAQPVDAGDARIGAEQRRQARGVGGAAGVLEQQRVEEVAAGGGAELKLVGEDAEGGRKRYEQKAGYNLAVALRDHRDEALRFLDDLAVPPTNNQAERDLRMMKLQMKISGCFRTLRGAECFATVRSYIETARKHSENPLAALEHLFRGEPWRIPRLAPS